MRKKIIISFLLVLIVCLSPMLKVHAVSNNLTNEGKSSSNGSYKIIIEDDANLLTPSEEKELEGVMAQITEFGNVIFKTTKTNSYGDVEKYAEKYYHQRFSNGVSGVIFVIDMQTRRVCVWSDGEIYKTVTIGKARSITDNIYSYASKAQYYKCATEAFSQINDLLNGRKIAESMKYICNAILAIMFSLYISFLVFMMMAKNNKASSRDLLSECKVSFEHTPIQVEKIGSHREYSPRDTGSSGSSSSGGGGGRRRRLFWRWWKSQFLSKKIGDKYG